MATSGQGGTRIVDDLKVGRPLNFPAPTASETADDRLRRTVPASAIRQLAADPERLVRVPVHLTNAIIDGDLQCAFVTFEYHCVFTGCTFLGRVDLANATFKRRASFDRSTFAKGATLWSAHALHDLDLSGCDVAGDVSLPPAGNESRFSDMIVDGTLKAAGGRFGHVTFDRVRVGKNAHFGPACVDDVLRPTCFRGRARFRDAAVGVNAVFQGARFEGEADFRRLAVKGAAVFDAPSELDGEKPVGGLLPVHFAQKANFEEARIGGSAFFDGVFFGGDAMFRALRVEGQTMFRAIGHAGAVAVPTFSREANFWRSHLSGNVEFRGAVFHGKALFSLSQFGGDLRFRPDLALDVDRKRDKTNGDNDRWSPIHPLRFQERPEFYDVKVNGTADFSGTYFRSGAAFDRTVVDGRWLFGCAECGPGSRRRRLTVARDAVSMIDTVVNGIANFEGVRLLAGGNFNRLRIKSNLFVRAFTRGARLWRPRLGPGTTFLEACVEGTADFNGAQFDGVVFSRMKVGGDAFWSGVVAPETAPGRALPGYATTAFTGAAWFDSVRIEGSARFSGAAFTTVPPVDPDDREVRFYRLSVGRDLVCGPFARGRVWVKARFDRPVSFTRVHVGGNADFFATEFSAPAQFESMHVHGHARFRPTTKPDTPPTEVAPVFHADARFWGARIEGALECNGCVFEGRSDFATVSVAGYLDFVTSRFERDLTLAQSRLSTLRLGSGETEAVFADDARVNLKGCTYTALDGSWKNLLTRLEPFDRQPYSELERVLRQAGHEREAGEVYLTRRRREGKQAIRDLRQRGLANRLTALAQVLSHGVQWGVFRYGVRPFRLFVGTALIVALGAWVFSQPGAVVERDAPAAQRPAGRRAPEPPAAPARDYTTQPLSAAESFGYSLRLFIPIVELPVGARWLPSPLARAGRTRLTVEAYASVHRLAGAILVPLGVAALTGLLVRRDKG